MRPDARVSMPSGSIQAIPQKKSGGVCGDSAPGFNAIWFDSSYSALNSSLVANHTTSFNAIWFDSSYSAFAGGGEVGLEIEFQCHLVRFKLFRLNFHGETKQMKQVSMPSGSIQAIPPEAGVIVDLGEQLFQCHLVRFKLFRFQADPARPDDYQCFNAIWFDSSYSAPIWTGVPSTYGKVSMPSGSIQAIPLYCLNRTERPL